MPPEGTLCSLESPMIIRATCLPIGRGVRQFFGIYAVAYNIYIGLHDC